MTPEESSWENEGGSCRPEPRDNPYRDTPEQPAIERQFDAQIAILTNDPSYSRPLTAVEATTLRLLAEEFFGSVQAANDGNLEGLEMAETQAFDYEPAMPAGAIR